MPSLEAVELSKFAQENAACRVWAREECLTLMGKQLQVRDIVCRSVVPFCEGGQRGWQAKGASNSGVAGGASSESY